MLVKKLRLYITEILRLRLTFYSFNLHECFECLTFRYRMSGKIIRKTDKNSDTTAFLLTKADKKFCSDVNDDIAEQMLAINGSCTALRFYKKVLDNALVAASITLRIIAL